MADFRRPITVILLAALILCGTVLIANYLTTKKAGNHKVHKAYRGTIMAFQVSNLRFSKGARVAMITGIRDQELILIDNDQQFSGCRIGDNVRYTMKDDAVTGIAFHYVPGSCKSRKDQEL